MRAMNTAPQDVMLSPSEKEREEKVILKTDQILKKYGSLAKFIESLKKSKKDDACISAKDNESLH